MGYLDNDGLSYLWGKIKAALAKKQDPLITSGASVGQAPVIKAVDAAGKPTQWEAASAPGVLRVNITDNTCDKTNAEIYEAFSAGKAVYCFFNGEYFEGVGTYVSGAEKYAEFIFIGPNGTGYSEALVRVSTYAAQQTVNVLNLWSPISTTMPVSADDNGKFLRVVDGAWVPASVPDANGGSF